MQEHKNLKLKCTVERFASRLLKPHAGQGPMGSLEPPYNKRRPASLLAKILGTLSRAFNTLKPFGVEIDGSTIRL